MPNTLKDVLLEKTATDLGQPLNVVETVMRWGFKDLNKAFKIYSLVEVSGWGQFYISQAKLRRRIEKSLRQKAALQSHVPFTDIDAKKLDGVNNFLNYLYSKLETNENNGETVFSNTGGLAQSHNSSTEVEREDRGNIEGQA